MVRESNPDQFQFAPHPFGVTVDEFGRHDIRRSEESGPPASQSRHPVCGHSPIIRATGLPFNSQLTHTGLEMTVELAARALDVDLLARELGNWRTSSRSGPA